MRSSRFITAPLAAVLAVCCTAGNLSAADKRPGWSTRKVDLRLTGGHRIVSISTPDQPRPLLRSTTGTLEATASTAATWPHPRVPIDGFSPMVAVVTSDYKATGDDRYDHLLTQSFVGNPLNPPASQNFAIGIFDSGSVVDLVGYCHSQTLGLTSDLLTPNTVTLTGASGDVEAPITWPVGMFAAGLSAVQPDGQLDTTQLRGHGNISVVVSPYEECGDGPELPVALGNVFVGFFTSVIRVDLPQALTHNGQTYASPEVQIKPLGSAPGIPVARNIRMTASGPGAITTAAYFPDMLDPYNPDQPWFPTLLAMYNGGLPLGGAFYAQIGALMGEPSPTNPLQTMRVLVDTGAQASIITPGMAGNLNLPLEPDFTIEVLGVGGMQEDVPGYFIDYVKINALGGAMEFSRVPFVVLNLASPDGLSMDGILGMNLLWNRNVVFDPVLQGDGNLRVSDPVLSPADLNRDTDVDADDFTLFEACFSGADIPQPVLECILADLDGDGDVDLSDFGRFQRCHNGPGVAVAPNCAQ
ncbi:MAG: clan AA aspartic protease [Phycisphaerae bacterium]|nr:clan AA aspartic protease [Phycisphaerae bacterium]